MKLNIRKLATAVAVTAGVVVTPAIGNDLPRGADVGPLAANCPIAKFPQTSKAGPYNILCKVMKDSEKCLALIKRQFDYDGQTVKVEKVYQEDVQRARYCLNILKEELGLELE